MGMRVSHYFEWEQAITGGQAQSVANQRQMLADHDIAYTTSPDVSADLLHLNNMGPRSVHHARRARQADTPVVVHTHQTAADFEDSFALSNLLARPMGPYLEYAYGLADVLVCPSAHNRDVIDRYTGVPKRVISNGFDPEKLDGHDDPDLRETYLDRYDLDPPVVFTVGHVLERKGLETFVETARAMPDTDFVWFGYLNPTGGFFGQFLRSSASKRLVDSAPDNCTFTGYVDDIAGAFAAGDLFYFPTRNENEGMALLEAMSTGAPPVIRGIDTYDWLTDGENCLKADSVDGFETALRRLIDDPAERERIGERARTETDRFALDAVGEQLVSLYRDLTTARQR